MAEKQAMIVAVDDSEHSPYTLEWTLDHFFVPLGDSALFKLVIVHAKPSATSFVCLTKPSSYTCGFQYFYLLILFNFFSFLLNFVWF
ncbi:hypothetical protein SLEP1_g23738 [Rubroshorea leprosula]|uniref:UspA domain-containing protein n=1 Tax=Rubroshorea leprosula TaxID=152421 RepID=A0AAV5JJJ6_9ROSI|nr:hypothetical protein SLEP1_g23738 [Rubroshorea leprosula]